MTWQDTRALGTISLAVVPSAVSGEERKRARDAIGKAADVYASIIEKEGYRLPLSAAATKKYPWGSNSLVLNNMIIFGLSYDFSRNKKHLEAMIAGMDYLLGRNPVAQSYVTGYGTRPLRNPHHRFWAQQLDQKYPEAPPGAVSGGPNSDIQDPQAKKSGLAGCAPQQCFVDHIEAWSVNEVTINWNAPFAWVAAYLDERGND
jgi:endoglucanase